jgi:hypothetical protein
MATMSTATAAKMSLEESELVHLLDNMCRISTWKCRKHGEILISKHSKFGGRDSDYGLNGPEFEPRCREDFPNPYSPASRPAQPPVQWAPCLSPGGKAAGAWR